ncbi:trigger factor, partial [Pseudomonadota bacterium]
MQVSVTSTEGLERRLTVEVPAERVEKEVVQRLKGLAGRVRLDGFRPGKIPMKVLEKRYGAQVRQEVQADVMQHSFYEAIEQESLRPAGSPKLELGAPDSEKFEFSATFEVYPEVKVEVPSDLVIEKPSVEVGDQDV